MADARASIAKPAVVARRPAVVAKPRAVAAVVRPPTAARSIQQRLGNQGTQAFGAQAIARASAPVGMSTLAGPIQPSLTISQPGDHYEQEAERVADAVMRAPATSTTISAITTVSPALSGVSRACTECQSHANHDMEKAEDLGASGAAHAQRKEASAPPSGVNPAIEANVHSLQHEGSSLPPATRNFFEQRMGADFSQVRVNTGSRADATAKSLGAKAFTVGKSISFASGQYAPESREGQHLLAHELTHVVQQDGGKRTAQPAAQRKESNTGEPVASPANINISRAAPGRRLQPAWYNVDIPFTNYQFDPSLQGLKTAAGVVKDVASDALEWIVDEIKSVVLAGKAWLTEKWNDLQDMASAAWQSAKDAFTNVVGFFKDPLGFLSDSIMKLDAAALARAWAKFSGVVTTIANGFKMMTESLLGGINRVWNLISGFATTLLNKVASLTSNSLFKKLPDFLQQVAFGVVNTLKSFWRGIDEGWTRLITKVKSWVDAAIDTVLGFVRKVLSFGINVVIAGIAQFAQLVLFLQDLFSDPRKYVDLLGKRTVQAFDGVEKRFAGLVAENFGSARKVTPVAMTSVKGPAANTTVHRAPDPKAAAEPKSSASWSDIGQGVGKMMGEKWDAFKANPLAVVIDLLIDLVFPMVGNIKDIIKLFKDIYHIVTGPLSAGSLEEFWTSLLLILDIPILIYHTVVSILMRTLMLPLIVASFIPHPLVKAIAAAVGYGLLGAFVQAELLNLGHKLLLLKTGATTKAQKEEAYNRIADSLIALAMTAAIILLMLILHFLINIAKGIYSFIQGKVFGIEPVPAEGKAPTPGEGKGGSKGGPEEGKGAEGKGPKDGTPSKDGNRKIRINEEGKCEVCASPCDNIRKKYGSLVTPEVEGKIKVIEDNPALSNAEKEAALKPIEQELRDALLAKSAAVKGPYSHLSDGTKIEPGKAFTDTQKPKILAENAKRNGGALRSDNPADPLFGQDLVPPQKGPFKPGEFPQVPENQAQIDHSIPRIGPDGQPLGSNAYSNAEVVSAKFNNAKRNKL